MFVYEDREYAVKLIENSKISILLSSAPPLGTGLTGHKAEPLHFTCSFYLSDVPVLYI